ncbi:MAG: acyltransferase, partial [Chloroflexales bacterium]|nr:acyltransferase [Chloroflexales bacterium]
MDQPAHANLRPAATLPYLPGLDGLRALALVAVLLYHAGVPWLPGGFLGVEAFFVLSGYLITTLLFHEWGQSGRVDVPAFWLRRARRLMPAASALIVAALALYVVFLPDEVASVRGAALAAFCYALNWQLVLEHKPYFATFGRPSPLQHMWSLAVEAQFYLLWPAVFGQAMRLGGRRAVLGVALVGAAASSVLMALLYQPGDDTTRLYYGTDTRLGGILLGAALACVCSPTQRRARWPGWANSVIGLGALGVLGWICYAIDEFHPLLYLGGFAGVALVAAAAVAASASGSARCYDALLGWRPLRWLGRRSYSIYLWHWPVMSLTRPALDLPLGEAPLLALQLGATLVAAELSYRLIESPL